MTLRIGDVVARKRNPKRFLGRIKVFTTAGRAGVESPVYGLRFYSLNNLLLAMDRP